MTECIVCQKIFKADIKSHKEKGEYTVVKAEDLLCSKECKETYNEALKNKKDACFVCGKKQKKKDIAAWHDDYKKKVFTPYCEKCLYPE
ncbi:hypothetical protein GF345_03780 [Candidatus Woesearchaeota archaeon]|nr:hypothetical protein [Candidatus Woesearchaeota archaeon]